MKDLTSGNLYKNFILFAIPMVLAGMLSQGYSMVDTIIAGKYLGSDGLAAVGATAPLITLISSVFWGFGNGFGVYIAKLFGAKEFKKIKASLYHNLLGVLLCMILTSLIFIIFRNNIYSLLRIDKTILSEADRYFTVIIISEAFIVFNNYGIYIMNAFGSSSFPLYMSILSAVINVGGNILLVAIFKVGVIGLAIATGFSAFVVDIGYFIKLKLNLKEIGVKEHKVRFSISYITNTFRYCIPTIFQQVVMYVSTMLVSPLVNGLGSAATASYTVTLRIYDFNASIYQNSARTLGNFTAQCIGTKETSKLKKGMRIGILQNLIFILPFITVCAVFPKYICMIFFKSGFSGESLQLSIWFLKYCLPLLVFNMVANYFHAFYRGAGAMSPLFWATLIGSASRLIFSCILIGYFGMKGFFIGWVISWISDGLFGFVFYLTGKWKQKYINLK